jgi:hypothetical protein
MELAPLHDALRADDAVAAAREAARLLAVDGAAQASAKSAVEAVEALVARHRPALAGGRWIEEWRAGSVIPDADLVAVLLERGRRAKSAAVDGPLPAWLLRDDRFRRAIGVNQHDGVEWFNKERWESALDRLALPAAQRKRLSSVAQKAGYRLDRLAAALGRAPAARPKATPGATGRAAGSATRGAKARVPRKPGSARDRA